MSLSDCIKCWSTPCECGHDYKSDSKEWMAHWIANITFGRNADEAEEILLEALEDVRARLKEAREKLDQ